MLARSGDPAPDGGRYTWFGDVDVGDDGCLLFHAGLTGCPAGEGIFLRTASGTRPVARAGDGHVSFARPTLASYPLPGGRYTRLAYLAHTADGRTSLVIWPSYREPSTVLTTGDEVACGVLEELTVSRPAFAVCAVARVRRGTGCRRVALLASEDQITWGSRLRDGGRFPGVGRITRLLGPPGMYVHHGFVAAELDDGGTALIEYSGGADPEVFVRSGTPAPGSDQHVARFGPAVANHGLPDAGPCGLASVVELDDGRSALWLGVFTGRQPMAGAAVLPLVSGDLTDDQPAARVDTFTPVKLTNTGILLLRCTTEIEGRATDGLLLFDHLFDWNDGS